MLSIEKKAVEGMEKRKKAERNSVITVRKS